MTTKAKLQVLDLIICSIWIALALADRYIWSFYSVPLLVYTCGMRLAVSFFLTENDKKAWIPLTSFSVSFLISYFTGGYHAFGDATYYLMVLIGSKVNREMMAIVGALYAFWILVLPWVYYCVCRFRKKLATQDHPLQYYFGTVLWESRKLRYLCAILVFSVLCLFTGLSMSARLCLMMCHVGAPVIFWLLMRYKNVKAGKVWLVVVAMSLFYFAQITAGVFRVALLLASLVMVAWGCRSLYDTYRSQMVTYLATLYLAVLIPSFCIGYNQYTCINYPRRAFYSLPTYPGIFYVKDASGEFMGLRSRYGLLVEPVYDYIRMDQNQPKFGIIHFILEKDGYMDRYDLLDNEVTHSTVDPDLQRCVRRAVDNYIYMHSLEWNDKFQVQVTDLRLKEVKADVRLTYSSGSHLSYKTEGFLPTEPEMPVSGISNDTLVFNERWAGTLYCRSYVENFPSDSCARYQVCLRMATHQVPTEADFMEITQELHDCTILDPEDD